MIQQKKPSRHFVLNLVVIALVVALLATVFVIGRGYNKKSATTDTAKKVAEKKVTDINNSIQSKNYDKAKEQVKQNYTDEKQQLLVLASVSISQGDYKTALEQYKQYEAKFPSDVNFGFDESVAQVYQQLKDKQNAAVYYQKAVDLLNNQPQNQFITDEINRLNKLIEQLKQ